jgi:RNA polymerase sigma factor (sigma-70 family)
VSCIEPVHDRRREPRQLRPDASPADLVAAVRAGFPGAWRAVVDRFDAGLHALGRGYGLDPASVDDAVQQTWLAALTHLDALRDPAALAGWLRSILHRECLRVLDRANREVPVVEHTLGTTVAPTRVTLRGPPPEPPEEQVIHRAQLADLRAAVRRRLSTREQALMALLSDAQEHSYGDIARTLGLPIGSIGPTRARCIAKLRPLLAG